MYEDKTLICRFCGSKFIFTAGEQRFFEEHALMNEPQHCPRCRRARRRAAYEKREMFEVICAGCGTLAKVPFEPDPERAVYCPDCYIKRERLNRSFDLYK